MRSQRIESAWHGEIIRQRRLRRFYWLGIGEAYMVMLAWTLITLAIILAIMLGVINA